MVAFPKVCLVVAGVGVALVAGCGDGGGSANGDARAGEASSGEAGDRGDVSGGEAKLPDGAGAEGTAMPDAAADAGREGPPPGVELTPTDSEGKAQIPGTMTTPRSLRVMDRATNRAVVGALVESAPQGSGTLLRIYNDEAGYEPTLVFVPGGADETVAIETERPDLRSVALGMDLELDPANRAGAGTADELVVALTDAQQMVFQPPPPEGFAEAAMKFVAYRAILPGVYFVVPEAMAPAAKLVRQGPARILPMRAARAEGPLASAKMGMPGTAGMARRALGAALATKMDDIAIRPARAAITGTPVTSGSNVQVAFDVTDPDGRHEGTLIGIDTTTPTRRVPRAERMVGDLPAPGPGEHFVCVKAAWLGGDRDETINCSAFTVAGTAALPDLRLSLAVAGGGAATVEGQQQVVDLRIENVGAAAAGPFDVEITESRDGIAEHGEGDVRVISLDGLGAGKVVARTAPWVPSAPGLRFVVARVDSRNVVAEAVEDNNRAHVGNRVAPLAANKAPVVAVAGAPRRAKVNVDTVILRALAHDAEDGDLGADVVWLSSREGVIGTGAELMIATGTTVGATKKLGEGRHRIFAEVADKAAANKRTARAEVELDVYKDVTTGAPPRVDVGPRRRGATNRDISVRGFMRDPDGPQPAGGWRLVSKPTGSAAALPVSPADGLVATFTPDMIGTYELVLSAGDGKYTDLDRLFVDVPGPDQIPNVQVTSSAGSDPVKFGSNVIITGSATDPDGDPVTISWKLQRPSGSGAALVNDDTISPILATDVIGEYTVTLYADDGRGGIGQASVKVVTNDGAPVAKFVRLSAGTTISATDLSHEDKDIEIGDGTPTTVTIDGKHSFRFLKINAGAVLKHSPATITTTSSLDLDITYGLDVAAGAAIDVSGLGYLGAQKPGNEGYPGRTRGNIPGPDRRVGGSHGGRGGAATTPAEVDKQSLPVYGDFRDPSELGSGGGSTAGGTSYDGGNGGGRVRIRAATITINGLIDASGEGSTYYGAGAGGSVRLEVTGGGAIQGTGNVRARGGEGYYAAGGGGRIAVLGYAEAASSIGTLLLDARGGHRTGATAVQDDQYGSAGTVFLKSATETGGRLIMDNGGFRPLSFDTALGVASVTLDRVSVKGSAAVSLGDAVVTDYQLEGGVLAHDIINVVGDFVARDTTVVAKAVTAANLKLQGTAVLTHPEASAANPPPSLSVTVGHLDIGSTAKIDVTARGYLGANRPGNIGSPARTAGNSLGPLGRVGGSHAGRGGWQGSPGAAPAPAPTYGDIKDPSLPGGGGGWHQSGYDGGDGGGIVRIKAAGATIAGIIDASGQNHTYGAGAGGSVKIEITGGGTLGVTGSVRARGGDSTYNGAGGGGRIAVLGFAGASSAFPASVFDARGGDYTNPPDRPDDRNGGAGTVFLKSAAETNGTLIIDGKGFSTDTVAPERYVPAGVTFDAVTVTGGAQAALGDLKTGNLTLGAGGVALDTVTLNGSLTLNGTMLETRSVTVGTLILDGNAVLTHPPTGISGVLPSLVVDVGTLTIRAGSRIDVVGRGYLGGDKGENKGHPGRTRGNLIGQNRYVGGSHGGQGGSQQQDITAVYAPSPSFGDFRDPRDLGGAGGVNNAGATNNGNGGGLVRVKAANITLDGLIDASGETAYYTGGAGGGIKIDVTGGGAITGSGVVRANGGGSSSYGTGSGGRIAIVGHGAALPASLSFEARGGDLPVTGDDDRRGTVGTIFLQRAGTDGDLIFDNQSKASRATFTDIGVSGLRFDRVTVVRGARVALRSSVVGGWTLDGSGVQTAVKVASISQAANLAVIDTEVEVGSVTVPGLTLSGSSAVAQAALSHPPAGVTNPVPSLTVDVRSGNVALNGFARLDVNGRGYLGGDAGDNLGRNQRTVGNTVFGFTRRTGGSHGGRGGYEGGGQAGDPNQPPAPAYGNFRAPTDLGGGGGCAACGGPGGTGGGRIHVQAVNLDLGAGTSVEAKGDPNYYGSGAGGSIFVELTGALTGSGAVVATGGESNGYSAGGGGRIAFVGYSGGTGAVTFDARGGDYTSDARPHDRAGNAGTVFLRAAGDANGQLVVDNKGVMPFSTASYSNLDVGTVASLTVQGGGRVAVGPGSAVSAWTLGAGYVSVDAMSVSGAISATDTVIETGSITAASLSVLGTGVISPRAAGVTNPVPFLNVAVGALTVAATARLDASARGYLGAERPGNLGNPGRTEGNVLGPAAFVGGSHGGRGGQYSAGAANGSAAVYDSIRLPIDLGGGGGRAASGLGGNGGGRIHIVTGTLALDGVLEADGEPYYQGGGAGGTVYVKVTGDAGFTGTTGKISARGGDTNGYAAGGGGRISVELTGAGSAVPAGIVLDAAGGDYTPGTPGAAYDYAGAAGTIFIRSSSETQGRLIIDNYGEGTRGGTLTVRTPINATLLGAIDVLEVKRKARACVVAGTLTAGSTMTDPDSELLTGGCP